MTETIKMIKKRASIRAFTDEALTNEQIQTLIDCALAAPSGANLQNWHFCVIKNKAVVEEIEKYLVDRIMAGDNEFVKKLIASRNNRIFFNGAVVIFIATKNGESLVDAGIAAENIVLAAESMGLGTCILGGCRDAFNLERGDYFKKLVGFPNDYEFAAAVTIGHPAVNATPHELQPDKVTII